MTNLHKSSSRDEVYRLLRERVMWIPIITSLGMIDPGWLGIFSGPFYSATTEHEFVIPLTDCSNREASAW